MSRIRTAASQVDNNVIVLDSDDEDNLVVSTSGQQTTQRLPRAGLKRSRHNEAQPPLRRRSMSRQAVDDEVVDLTSACSSHAQRILIQNSNQPAAAAAGSRNAGHSADILTVQPSSNSPSAKRKVAVAKALQAHRKQGQEIAAMHDIHKTKEVDSKPKCGICLDDMKEPACGTCGHVFCRACLLSCIKATKKCPTCRKNLQPRTVHRIYLS